MFGMPYTQFLPMASVGGQYGSIIGLTDYYEDLDDGGTTCPRGEQYIPRLAPYR